MLNCLGGFYLIIGSADNEKTLQYSWSVVKNKATKNW